MTYADKEKSDIFKCLTQASDPTTLIQIKKELDGRADPDAEDDEKEDEASEEDIHEANLVLHSRTSLSNIMSVS
jgi:hypothetical protein